MTDIVERIRSLRYVHVPVASQLFEEAAQEIERLRDERRWIPVSERLPEDGQSVLACFEKSGGVGCATFVELYKWFETDRGCFGATHWMPLPEPPEATK